MQVTINTRAFRQNCGTSGNIELTSFSFAEYGNLTLSGSATVHPDDLKALRDALIGIYPIEQTKPWAPEPKWEVVTDGLDRIKVEGGYIYQNDTGAQTFIPTPSIS